jgi:tRNA (guanine37-N1)-methyltransferase
MSPRKKIPRIDVVTLFPRMLEAPLAESLLGKARDAGRVDVGVHDLRRFSKDKHRKVDDRTFGGGAGMVIQAEPLYQVLRFLKATGKKTARSPRVIYMSPQGRPLTQKTADGLAAELQEGRRLVLLCGHYEGIDERVFDWIDDEISLGDVVFTGGEIPALALVDAVVRKLPGVVKEKDSLAWDSFAEGWQGRLDCPHYTRPALWRGRPAPAALLSGDHGAIARWRDEMSRSITRRKRPDLGL